MLQLACTNEEKIQVTLNPVTAAGHPIAVENFTVEVQSGDGTAEIISGAPGTYSFWIISGAGVGDSVFVVTADADLGLGIVNVADFITLTVEGAKASALGLVADKPVVK